MNLYITIGLKGSGKKEWCIEHNKKNNSVTIDFDKCSNFNYLLEKIENSFYLNKNRDICLCGQIIEQKTIEGIINFIIEKKYKIDNVYLEYWNLDIPSCIWNSEDVNYSIKTMDVDLNYLKSTYKDEKISLKINMHSVIKIPKWKKFTQKLGIYIQYGTNENHGDSWSNGGTYGNCWDDNKYSISPSEPSEPTTFDYILTKVAPNVSFLMYKKLKNNCLSIKQMSDSDYYGGVEYSSYWCINMEELYNQLIENRIIDEDKFFL